MGKCKYCGQPAGFLRWKHRECHQAYLAKQAEFRQCRQQMLQEIVAFVGGANEYSLLETRLGELESSVGLPEGERNGLLVQGWERAVKQALEDSVLEEKEEQRLVLYYRHFGLTQADLDRNGAFTQTAKAGLIREVLNGEIPDRFKLDGDLPINFQKSEKVVWVFPRVKYLEDKVRRQFVGGSQGMSFKVAKGVYYRAGSFKGRSVESTERVHTDTGFLAVTSKHIYFHGARKSFKIPYPKIVSFEAFGDGIGVMRDAQTAKAQIFVTGDGWFSYNLIANLARL